MKENKTKHAIVIFVKTPGFSPIKTRLAKSIGKIAAEEFYRLSIAAIQQVISTAVKSLDRNIVPFWAVAENDLAVANSWTDFEIIFQRGDSLGERLYNIHNDLVQRFDSVAFIGGDAPQINVDLIKSAFKFETGVPQVNVGPACDGGFYLFSSNSPIDKSAWLTPIYSGAETLSQLLNCLEGSHRINKLPMLTDVDAAEDLSALRFELESLELLTLEQKELLSWVRES